ncbi:MAG: hypothetical protein OQK95_11845 [Gammaproteobacteria bacterium]|nr:hypothetical protein [Gammaproteobacteria bacterium]
MMNSTVNAGSEFYLGADVLGHNLKTSSTTVVTQTSPASSSTTFGDTTKDTTDIGFRTGYKFKSRLTDRYFWAPEFSLATFDKKLLYGTHLKFGYEFAPIELYTTLGVSRIETFTDNRLNIGLGMEYRLSNQSSINVEFVHYDNINEDTSSTSTIGLSTITINTDSTRKLNSIKIGYTYYFQGSI